MAEPVYVPSLNPLNGDSGFANYGVALQQGQAATLQILVTNTAASQTTAYLNAWIDFNNDGSFEADEQVVTAFPVAPGVNTYSVPITVPLSAVVGTTWIRFRLSTTEALGPDAGEPNGAVPDGDVQDYQVTIQPAPAIITGHVYDDLNGNGTHDAGEPGLAGWIVAAYQSSGTPISTTTAADGSYTLAVPPGTYAIQETLQSGWAETAPAAAYNVTAVSQQTTSGEDFENFYTAPLTVQSIVKSDPDPNNETTVHYAVTFVEPVTGVVASDFTVATTAFPSWSISSITPTGTAEVVGSVSYYASWSVAVATGPGTVGTLSCA